MLKCRNSYKVLIWFRADIKTKGAVLFCVIVTVKSRECIAYLSVFQNLCNTSSPALQPLQNPLLSVYCPQAARLCSPRKLDVKCAFGPSKHIIELNHWRGTVCNIQQKCI